MGISGTLFATNSRARYSADIYWIRRPTHTDWRTECRLVPFVVVGGWVQTDGLQHSLGKAGVSSPSQLGEDEDEVT